MAQVCCKVVNPAWRKPQPVRGIDHVILGRGQCSSLW